MCVKARLKKTISSWNLRWTVSTDDFAGPLQLQTNLALKGILGIKAMSQIAQIYGNADDVEYYKVRIGRSPHDSTF